MGQRLSRCGQKEEAWPPCPLPARRGCAAPLLAAPVWLTACETWLVVLRGSSLREPALLATAALLVLCCLRLRLRCAV